MKLYLIRLVERTGWDFYDSAVVAAEDITQAVNTKVGDPEYTWANPGARFGFVSGTFGVELEGGEIVNYGSTCVVRNLGFADRKAFNKAMRKDQDDRAKAARIRFINTSEYAAQQIAFDRAHADVKAGKLEIGIAFRNRTADACAAAEARKAAIAAEFGLASHAF